MGRQFALNGVDYYILDHVIIIKVHDITLLTIVKLFKEFHFLLFCNYFIFSFVIYTKIVSIQIWTL